MKKHHIRMLTIGIAVLMVCFLAVMGCSKKSVQQGDTAGTQAPQAAQPAADTTAKAPAKPVDAAQPGEGEVKQKAAATATAATVDLEDIRFDYDKSVLRPGDRDVLKRHADWLMKNKDAAIVIEGHCDERGTTEYNLALGERRAGEAMKYLIGLGIAKERIKTISYGEERPLDPGHTEEAWAKNRRDHFVVKLK